jgi:hypothetical protein
VKQLTFYEQVGIIIPGALFLFGLLFFFPALRDLLAKDNNLVAACGNAGETLLWGLVGGMPSDWVVKPDTNLISPQQRELVEKKLLSRLAINVESIRGLDKKIWWPISRQLYSYVEKHGKLDRIDTFNGNYGLNRGLASACLLLAFIGAYQNNWQACVLLAVLTIAFAYRTYRFGVLYARELYLQFLTISDAPTKKTRGKAVE